MDARLNVGWMDIWIINEWMNAWLIEWIDNWTVEGWMNR